MSQIVDHQTIGHELKQTHLKGLKLLASAINVYPKNDSFLLDLAAQTNALGSLINELASHHHAEVNDAELEALGVPYEFDLDEDQWDWFGRRWPCWASHTSAATIDCKHFIGFTNWP